MFPEIEPYQHGMLSVGDGQNVYWEACGNPSGKPALVLHGGPGSGCTSAMRRMFDPEEYRIVLFDQRGCGRSTPRVDAASDLTTNTTHRLIDDIETLSLELGVRRWVLFGSSWGSTLALAYAEAHPERVEAMVLASVTTTTRREIRWLYHEMGRFLPEAWERFRKCLPEEERDGDLVAAYSRLLHGQHGVEVKECAAKAWCGWEDAASPLPGGAPNPRYADPGFRMTFARIVTHYFHHHAWLREDQLLDQAFLLEGIPGVLIHGRLDLGSPVDTAWRLTTVWRDAELRIVETGHAGGDEMTGRIVDATQRFA